MQTIVLMRTACEDDAAADNDAAAGNANNNANGNANGNEGATATTGVNVNAFTGSVGSAPVPVISSNADKPFSVNGAEFLNQGAAIQRACDVQKNACANAANGGDASISVADCDAQQQQCVAQNAKKRRQSVDTGNCGSPAISFGQQDDRATRTPSPPSTRPTSTTAPRSSPPLSQTSSAPSLRPSARLRTRPWPSARRAPMPLTRSTARLLLTLSTPRSAFRESGGCKYGLPSVSWVLLG
ncbi:hypothetical protein K449DRAFT_85936 [Hypoxylon sp. EC38]|nr:hypothetical protein K449DRAFT_85936 [Hypoxylon sp. EC38]